MTANPTTAREPSKKPRALVLAYTSWDALELGIPMEHIDEYPRGALAFGTKWNRLMWDTLASKDLPSASVFAAIQTLQNPGEHIVRVTGDEMAVFLNGRQLEVGSATKAFDGDVLRIAKNRFCFGRARRRYPRDDIERAFLTTIQEHPAEDEPRIVYADWLEERGDMAQASLLRTELEIRQRGEVAGEVMLRFNLRVKLKDDELLRLIKRFRAAANDIESREWRTLVARPMVESCGNNTSNGGVRFELVCPKRWENLAPTKDANRRHCNACEQVVVLCKTAYEAREIAVRGGCVAIEPGTRRTKGDLEPKEELRMMTVGRVVPEPEEGEEEDETSPTPML